MTPLLPMVIVIAVCQAISIFMTKKPIESLNDISRYCLDYLVQTIKYLTGLRKKPPFPFSS